MKGHQMTDEIQDINFEEALRQLEEIVTRLESGDLALEEAMALFEEGQRLTALCNARLESAALRVEQLTSDGEIIESEIS
jgi:exodeoxyribonuclease VII small subunit